MEESELSKQANLLRSGKGGLLLVGLPRASELIIQVLTKKTGKNAAQLIGASLQHLANEILDEKEKQEVLRILKEHS